MFAVGHFVAPAVVVAMPVAAVFVVPIVVGAALVAVAVMPVVFGPCFAEIAEAAAGLAPSLAFVGERNFAVGRWPVAMRHLVVRAAHLPPLAVAALLPVVPIALRVLPVAVPLAPQHVVQQPHFRAQFLLDVLARINHSHPMAPMVAILHDSTCTCSP